MSVQSTTASVPVQSKQSHLREIVARLGKDATGAQVREEAYRVGFGAVNSSMLTWVRNQLWPDRPKRKGGGDFSTRRPSLFACPACGSPRTTTSGRYVSRAGVASRKITCRDCGGRSRLTGAAADPMRSRERDRQAAAAATEKKCTCCLLILPVDQFGMRDEGPQRRSYCRKCSNAKRAQHQLKQVLGEFGLTPESYERMLKEQGHGCAICGTTEPGTTGKRPGSNRRFAIDHCHTTGKARGLLCNKCNLGIGNFNDDIVRLEAAVAYLRKHREDATVEQERG